NPGASAHLTGSGSAFNGAYIVAGVSHAWTARLDLDASALIVQTTDANDEAAKAATLADQILSGMAAGAWNGNGITSTTVASDQSVTGSHHTTIAIFDNADFPGQAAFNGKPVDPNSLIVTRALLGDADNSQIVDAADFDIWFKHVGNTNSFLTSQGD